MITRKQPTGALRMFIGRSMISRRNWVSAGRLFTANFGQAGFHRSAWAAGSSSRVLPCRSGSGTLEAISGSSRDRIVADVRERNHELHWLAHLPGRGNRVWQARPADHPAAFRARRRLHLPELARQEWQGAVPNAWETSPLPKL